MQQTVQCLANSWQNTVGSTSIADLLAFFDSQEDLRDSDDERQEFCKYHLQDLCFLYRDVENPNKKARKSTYYPIISRHPSKNNTMQLEMGGALPQHFRPPNICCTPHCHRGFQDNSRSP